MSGLLLARSSSGGEVPEHSRLSAEFRHGCAAEEGIRCLSRVGGAPADGGVRSFSALLTNSDLSSAILSFQKSFAGIRKVYRMNINRVLADL